MTDQRALAQPRSKKSPATRLPAAFVVTSCQRARRQPGPYSPFQRTPALNPRPAKPASHRLGLFGTRQLGFLAFALRRFPGQDLLGSIDAVEEGLRAFLGDVVEKLKPYR